MLRNRLLSAFFLASSALVFVALDAIWEVYWALDASGEPVVCNGFWMMPLGAYLMFGSAIECAAMTRLSSIGSIKAPALIGCGAVMLAAMIPVLWPLSGEPYPLDCPLGKLGWPLAAAAIAMLGCFSWFVPRYEPHSGIFLRSILAGWVSVYFGVCFAFLVALRLTGESHWGLFLLVGVIVVTKSADTGAYFSGRAFGRTKLCPAVSPGKTIEGLVGGMLVAVIVAAIYFGVCAAWWFGADRVHVSALGVLLMGILLTLVGAMGDLLESIFKREMGCKDSGGLLPGLGGLWDVTDSLLPASVAGYLIIVAELIRGPGQ